MRVVVQGPGSLGSLVGGLLAAAGEDVVLLGRPDSDHLDRVAAEGLVVEHSDGSQTTTHPATATDPAVVADADLVVVCVKSYDTESAAEGLSGHVDGTDPPAVLSLQNGLGNVETLAESIPTGVVLAGTTTNGAVREAPGVVRHAGEGETTVGRYAGESDAFVREVADTLSAAGLGASVTDDPQRAVWTKVLVNAGINAATALARVPNGALVEQETGERLLERAVEEGASVARAEDVDVPDDVVERARGVAEQTASNHSSMRQDLERGSRTEVEALHGALADRAHEHGVDAPVNQTLADLVRLAERGEN
ncbi:ketopantoate reductase family protein [Halobacterium rubrum]|uniref:ketopantoate reductase family protein n=1 Tax=Halobacterium TaxID=2239 RepID=UPI001F36BB27|nr:MULTISPECIES: ketopantoate reductase family protein [Halobacterium]MDH5020942.1 ketopantoate reductase family protein [Halobacterium rubrum]